jgi:hypothetical protein
MHRNNSGSSSSSTNSSMQVRVEMLCSIDKCVGWYNSCSRAEYHVWLCYLLT